MEPANWTLSIEFANKEDNVVLSGFNKKHLQYIGELLFETYNFNGDEIIDMAVMEIDQNDRVGYNIDNMYLYEGNGKWKPYNPQNLTGGQNYGH